MIHFAFCDDSLDFLNTFGNCLSGLCKDLVPDDMEYVIASPFKKGDEVLDYVKNNPIDILFLDIDMPYMTGFEIAKELVRNYKDIRIVFMSAFDNFVFDSFEYYPFGYLRKQELESGLPRIIKRLIKKLNEPIKKIVISTKDGDIPLMIEDMLYIESTRNYYTVYTKDGGVYECRGTMSQAEDLVLHFDFFRAHSAFLINLHNVERIIDSCTVRLKGGITVPVAQKRMTMFKKAYMAYTRKLLNI